MSILSGAAAQSETATELIVTVRGSWEQGREKLATIEAVVKRAGTVTLKLTDFVWDDALVNTTRRNGRIRISVRKNR